MPPLTPSYTFSVCSLTCVSVSPSSFMFTLTTPGPPVISQGAARASTAGRARTASARSRAHALPDSAARPAPTRHNRMVSARARTTRHG
jgi:hypothetical protein